MIIINQKWYIAWLHTDKLVLPQVGYNRGVLCTYNLSMQAIKDTTSTRTMTADELDTVLPREYLQLMIPGLGSDPQQEDPTRAVEGIVSHLGGWV